VENRETFEARKAAIFFHAGEKSRLRLFV